MWLESQNYAIVRTELDEVFFQNFNKFEDRPGYASARDGELFKVNNIDRAFFIGEVNMGPGLFKLTSEIGTVTSDTPVIKNKYTIQVNDWTNAIEPSKDFFDDEQHEVWAKDCAELALMARVTQDFYAFGIFRGAFGATANTAATLTADGNALVGSHTLINGSTYNNQLLSTTFTNGVIALNSTGINNAIVMLGQQPNQKGITMGQQPKILLVPTPLFKTAREETDSVLTSDSANNAVNVYRSVYGFTVKTSQFMDSTNGGSDTAWFLLSENHSVTRLVRQGMVTNLRDWSFSNNRTYFYQANYRESYYVPDYVGVVGSLG